MAAKPPDEVPDEFKEDVAKLHKPLAAILVGKEISWAAQAALGASGYVTVEDLADRWDTPAAARENGPRDLGFRDGENGFNVQTLAFTAMRLLQAVRVAASLVRGGNQGDHPAGQWARRRRPWRSCVTGASWRMLTWPFMEPRSRGWSSKGVMATSRSSGV